MKKIFLIGMFIFSTQVAYGVGGTKSADGRSCLSSDHKFLCYDPNLASDPGYKGQTFCDTWGRNGSNCSLGSIQGQKGGIQERFQKLKIR